MDDGRVNASDLLSRASDRVREIASDWEPPDFGHVPDADAAIFLCAVDHKTGYSEAHEVDGEGPFEGSELMWMLGLKAAADEPGVLTSKHLRYVSAGDVAEWFRADSEPIGDPNGAPPCGAISPPASNATTAAPRSSSSPGPVAS